MRIFKVTKQFVIFFTINYFIISTSFAAQTDPISVKLWGGLKVNDVENLKKIVLDIDSGNFSSAAELTNSMQEQNSSYADAALDIVLWRKYSQNKIDTKNIAFGDISRFINDNDFFPGLNDLRRNAEKIAVASNIPYNFSEQYFKSYPAKNLDSKLYLLKSKINYLATSEPESEKEKKDLNYDIQQSISDIWMNEDFSSTESERKFLENYGSRLTEIDYVKRIDRLLWVGKIADAKRFLGYVNEEYNQLFSAIIDISENPKYIENVILSVPRKLRSHEGLYYRKILYYRSKGKEDDVLSLLLKVPPEASYSDKWWSLRKFYCREMLKKKDYKSAYTLAANNGLKAGSSDFADAEWLAGWISLRFLHEAKIAYKHFNNVYLNVAYPVSISRAAYWLGMASQAMHDTKQAIDWYKIASKYPIYFYGQVAIHKHRTLDSIAAQNDIILPKDPEILAGDIDAMSKTPSVKVAYLLALMGDKKNALKIFEYAINNAKSDGEIVVVMKLAKEFNDAQLNSKVAKMALKRNVVFISDRFRIIREVEKDPYAPLIHAIIKQESDFSPTALSSVGAIGFMQLMPDTAKHVSKQVGLSYNKDKLSRDGKYNIILGSYYTKSLIEKFNGSELLAIASYNAGPSATQRWIDEFYDPRKQNDIDKVVDWIELITYSETRNYVQRIMENLIVYKYIMSRINYDDIK